MNIKIRTDLISNNNLNDNAKYVYMIITGHMNSLGQCYLKRETIVKESGLAASTVTRLLKNLQTEGFLKVKTEYCNGEKINKYKLPKSNSNEITIDLDILINKELSIKDIIYYVILKKTLIDEGVEQFIGTKAELINKTGVDRKKTFESLRNLENANLISTTNNTNFTLKINEDIKLNILHEKIEIIKNQTDGNYCTEEFYNKVGVNGISGLIDLFKELQNCNFIESFKMNFTFNDEL